MFLIRIEKPNFFTNCWYDSHVGEVFEASELKKGVPSIYTVDVTRLYESGELPSKTASVPEPDASFVADVVKTAEHLILEPGETFIIS